MNTDVIMSIMGDAIWTLFIVASPVLGTGFVVGVLVSMIQAVMQLHEMTIAFVPKMIAIGVVIILTGGWMLTKLSTYTANILTNFPNMVGQ